LALQSSGPSYQNWDAVQRFYGRFVDADTIRRIFREELRKAG
jgi:hypothetical protein